MTEPMFQVAVIGGGPAGAVAARLLATAGMQVALIERGRKRSFKAGETLPPVANPVLRRLGLWSLLTEGHMRCPGNRSAFGSEALVDLDFIRSANGAGWHLDRIKFETALQKQAIESGVNFHRNALVGLKREGTVWDIPLADGSHLTANFVIDASGGARAVLRRLNVAEARYDQLAACVGIYQCDVQQDHRTIVEATQDGWWYSAGLPKGQRAVMYFSDTDLESYGQVRKSFDVELSKTRFVCREVQRSNALGAPDIFVEPAYSAHAAQVAGPGWLALGDAAMRFDPLSSQGLWTSFLGAEKAVSAILDGSESTLRGYAGWCTETFRSYLSERSKYYEMELRWPHLEFWQRRRLTSQLRRPA
ncbi:tryptophan 7-halogenase [Planktotalea sp.]|uniref:tryptophan 7-halogenase n=1 Tax=Planktotalea sp. TaxID=2029877 RepID=UPI0032976EB6